MFGKTRPRPSRLRAQLALATTLPLLMLLPMTAGATAAEEATDLAGTEFVKCSETAWANYNSCLMDSSSGWERTLCDLAFDADVVYCGAVYYRRIRTGT